VTSASNVLDQDGKKSEPFGADAKGTVVFTSRKRVAAEECRRPKRED
jgi:hypothetical protein